MSQFFAFHSLTSHFYILNSMVHGLVDNIRHQLQHSLTHHFVHSYSFSTTILNIVLISDFQITDWTMTQVLPLGTLACLSAVQTLLQHRDDSGQHLHLYLLARLQTDRFTAVSEKILQRLRQDHPQKLTNQLLLILAPPSLRQLSLAKCSSVTALGIEKVLKR